MALDVNSKINQNGDMADGYLAIDNISFIRGNMQMGNSDPSYVQPKFSIQVFYTIYTDDTKSTARSRGQHTLPWDDAQDTSNAFSYAYDILKTLDIYNGATDC